MRIRPATLIALALVSLGACARPPQPGPPLPAGCRLLPPSSRHADTVTVALLDPVWFSFAPWGHTAAEQLVFAQLYETLVTVDCDGEVHGALASSWKREDGGRRWSFVVRRGARFWDGTPLRAADVVASWADALTLPCGIDSAAATRDDRVVVFASRPERRVPAALASSAFAVAGPLVDGRWPLGTGPYEVADDAPAGPTLRPARGAAGPVIRFVTATAGDARDLIGGGADVLVTADPAVVEYAAGQPSLSTPALPWETTYALLSPSRALALRAGAALPALPEALLESLAHDAVRADARAATRPPWWDEAADCTPTSPTLQAAAPSGPTLVVYDALDPVARDLANRIVALAAAGPQSSGDTAALLAAVPSLGAGPSTPVARGVDRPALDWWLRHGAEAAYVVALPRETPLACYEGGDLAKRAPWLSPGFDAAIPLVDTRAHVVAADCGVDLVVDRYGVVRIVAATTEGR